ncbi:hypothetical protein H6G89_28030 [Oscillatoria sp. FACHB-1407]|uniref:hypothetical protein n=1 Tax=Oscillatoria sp. FACHB-1407 TaxID=2692847 RepID=UPI00168295DF|nr:hypothetical protein [Oscillatoria sp. FACHB-1407]MBD2464856.1 hypothetical protein [Oscillatoria sp. FACHB-1407]
MLQSNNTATNSHLIWQWTLATALAGAIVGALEAGGWQFFATLILSGVAVGIAQYFIVRRYVSKASWWVVASTFGWIGGVFLQTGLSGLVFPVVTALTRLGGWEVLWLNVLDQPITTLVLGLAQWFVLRRSLMHSQHWIWGSAIAGVFLGAVGATVCYVGCEPIANAAGGIVTGAIVNGSAWAIYGLVTGWLLQHLMRKD